MANKTENFINFKKLEDYRKAKEAGELKNTSLIFVEDAHMIVTHGVEYYGDISSEAITDLKEILS